MNSIRRMFHKINVCGSGGADKFELSSDVDFLNMEIRTVILLVCLHHYRLLIFSRKELAHVLEINALVPR